MIQKSKSVQNFWETSDINDNELKKLNNGSLKTDKLWNNGDVQTLNVSVWGDIV